MLANRESGMRYARHHITHRERQSGNFVCSLRACQLRRSKLSRSSTHVAHRVLAVCENLTKVELGQSSGTSAATWTGPRTSGPSALRRAAPEV